MALEKKKNYKQIHQIKPLKTDLVPDKIFQRKASDFVVPFGVQVNIDLLDDVA